MFKQLLSSINIDVMPAEAAEALRVELALIAAEASFLIRTIELLRLKKRGIPLYVRHCRDSMIERLEIKKRAHTDQSDALLDINSDDKRNHLMIAININNLIRDLTTIDA